MEVHAEDLRGQDRCRYKLETGKIITLHHQVGLLFLSQSACSNGEHVWPGQYL